VSKLTSAAAANSWDVPADAAQRFDPLLECLVQVTSLLGRPASAPALLAGLPTEGRGLTPELFVRAAANAGLAAKVVGRPMLSLTARPSRSRSARSSRLRWPLPRQTSAVGRISRMCWNAQRFHGGRSQSMRGGTSCGGAPCMIGGRGSELRYEVMSVTQKKKGGRSLPSV